MEQIKPIEILPSAEAPEELGFQAYEMLNGDGAFRDSQRTAFVADESYMPVIDYPKLDTRILTNSIKNLAAYMESTREMPDVVAADAIWNSASFRMAEMYWLMEADRNMKLGETEAGRASDEYVVSADRLQRANEELYGTPDRDTVRSIYGEVLAQANSKELHPDAQRMLSELTDGFDVTIDGQSTAVEGIGTDYDTRLPQDIPQKLAGLKEFLKEKFSVVFEEVDAYWEDELIPDDKGVKSFDTDDIKEIFTRVHHLYDPNDESGISIQLDEGARSLSWSSNDMAVKIGTTRKSIKSKWDMAAKIIHEYGNHGVRSLNGSKSDLPIMKTGVFSDAQDGERADYLTFEEGFASMCEIAVDDSFEGWKPMHVTQYMALATAYEGADFRQIYERAWRARVVMVLKPGEEPTGKLVNKQKREAYNSTLRVLRGTPITSPAGQVTTYNKDLAYLNGKMDVFKYIDSTSDEVDPFSRLFKGKFDPNNAIQNELANKYCV